VASHQPYDSWFIQTKLRLDGLKRCTVFPGHFDYARNIGF